MPKALTHVLVRPRVHAWCPCIGQVVFCAMVILVERRAIEAIKSKLVAAIHSNSTSGGGGSDESVDIDVAAEADRVRKIVAARRRGDVVTFDDDDDVVLLSDLHKTFVP